MTELEREHHHQPTSPSLPPPPYNPTLPVCVASRRPEPPKPLSSMETKWKIGCDDAFSLTAHRSSTMPRRSSSPGSSWQSAPSLASLSSNSNEAGDEWFKKNPLASLSTSQRDPRHARYGHKTKRHAGPRPRGETRTAKSRDSVHGQTTGGVWLNVRQEALASLGVLSHAFEVDGLADSADEPIRPFLQTAAPPTSSGDHPRGRGGLDIKRVIVSSAAPLPLFLQVAEVPCA